MGSVVEKPVIGRPVATPATPKPGVRFTVWFKVTDGIGRPLTRGAMVCDPSVAGVSLAHTESFRGGIARVSFLVPMRAAGELLRVRVTIGAGGQTATRIAAFRVPALPKPSLSISGGSVVEGNTGTAVLSFPVTLSGKTPLRVSVWVETANRTATAPADYKGTSAVLIFEPGETRKTFEVSVRGETVYEPDETFTVNLSLPVNATIAMGSATGTIQNDDPYAQLDHYQGTTSTDSYVSFDVIGSGLTNLTINPFYVSCTPSVDVEPYVFSYAGTIPIGTDGCFSASVSFTGETVAGQPVTSDVFTIAGQFTNNTASGTFNETIGFNYQGLPIDCTTGNQTWFATRTS
jgi:hypothetical protein